MRKGLKKKKKRWRGENVKEMTLRKQQLKNQLRIIDMNPNVKCCKHTMAFKTKLFFTDKIP